MFYAVRQNSPLILAGFVEREPRHWKVRVGIHPCTRNLSADPELPDPL